MLLTFKSQFGIPCVCVYEIYVCLHVVSVSVCLSLFLCVCVCVCVCVACGTCPRTRASGNRQEFGCWSRRIIIYHVTFS